jgi:hypothetical protein
MVYGYAGRQTANTNDLTGRDSNVLFAFSVDGKWDGRETCVWQQQQSQRWP